MIRKITLILLAFCMVLALAACTTTQEPQQTEEDKNDMLVLPDGRIGYEITVVDEMSQPMAGVIVQLGDDEHDVDQTDAQGVVRFAKEAGNYAVRVVAAPPGYALGDDAFTFLPGSSEMKIILPKA